VRERTAWPYARQAMAGFLLVRRRMRYFQLGAILLGVILILGTATPVRAETGLTTAVAKAWFPRNVADGLQDIAQRRVVEISRCRTCMNHDLQRRGTAEVLGWNAGYSDPIAQVIWAWKHSNEHNTILSDRRLDRIGCAHRRINGRHYFACVLTDGRR
jgi:alkylhydroperoxidase family enzyme